jgi:hypothetical protein
MAETFEFSTGLRQYDINGYRLSINPTDAGFVSAFNKMLKQLSAKQDEVAEVMRDADDDAEKVVEALDEYCEFGVAAFDTCFGEGASYGMFGGCSPFAIQPETRLPLWVILCDYISSVIMTALEELPEETKTDKLLVSGARSKALLQKYKIKH